MADIKRARPPQMQMLPRLIFMTRWLQVPLYVGLIVAHCVYVWQFLGSVGDTSAAAAGKAVQGGGVL
jgi:uncharacterized membrane protein YqhA